MENSGCFVLITQKIIWKISHRQTLVETRHGLVGDADEMQKYPGIMITALEGIILNVRAKKKKHTPFFFQLNTILFANV